ncbi:hypothetical protein FB451DRAFT_1365460 [Mycena latifolia]|nr:hypothetical protein FB451DRAFT_1365460 [Mycena latifolia]
MNAELLLEKETTKNIEKNKVQRGNTISNSFYTVIEYTRVTNVIDPKTGLVTPLQHIVPIAVVQNKTQPYVETNYSMPSFAEYVANRTTNTDSGGSAVPPGASAASEGSDSSSQTTGASGARSLRASVLALVLALLGTVLCLYSPTSLTTVSRQLRSAQHLPYVFVIKRTSCM